MQLSTKPVSNDGYIDVKCFNIYRHADIFLITIFWCSADRLQATFTKLKVDIAFYLLVSMRESRLIQVMVEGRVCKCTADITASEEVAAERN